MSSKASSAVKPRRSRAPLQPALEWDDPIGLICGVDEAGRGPLAGPVVAAAVILNPAQPIAGLADSKVLTALRREKLFAEIHAKAACVSVAEASVEEIDQLNILQATLLAMQRAVAKLRLRPTKVLVDGNRLPKLDVFAEAIVRGDSKVAAISAASIVAKVTRDQWCLSTHVAFPEYGLDRHKGYGTALHMTALRAHGPAPWHRRSFAPVREALGSPNVREALETPNTREAPGIDAP
jgi:ribonuclease HII